MEECTSPQNPIIWQILAYLLNERSAGTDLVVRVSAAMALRRCLDVSMKSHFKEVTNVVYFDEQTRDFDANVVEGFIRPLTAELLNLISEAETFEMKRKLVETMNVLIEQQGTLVSAC